MGDRIIRERVKSWNQEKNYLCKKKIIKKNDKKIKYIIHMDTFAYIVCFMYRQQGLR